MRLGLNKKRRVHLFSPHVYFSCARLSSFLIPLLIVCLICMSACTAYKYIYPVILNSVETEAITVATKFINETVSQELAKGGYGYEDFVSIATDSDGKIQSISSKTDAINKFKADIANTVTDRAYNYDNIIVPIPIGSFLSPALFSGSGPKINFHLSPNGYAKADFESTFSEAGINQTKHEISITVSVKFSMLARGEGDDFLVSTTVPIAQTVIVGSVPQTYAELDLNSLIKESAEQ